MYLGEIIETLPRYRDVWHEGIGTLAVKIGTQQRTLHTYRCESCGSVVHVLLRADEPFYCRNNHLIDVR